MGVTKIFVPKLSAGVAGPRTGREPPRQRGLGAATLRFLRGALGDREAAGWVVMLLLELSTISQCPEKGPTKTRGGYSSKKYLFFLILDFSDNVLFPSSLYILIFSTILGPKLQ